MIIVPLNFRGRSRAFDPRVLFFRILFLNLAIELGRIAGNDFYGALYAIEFRDKQAPCLFVARAVCNSED